MPEIKNSFVKGKMNQDLDERLIPKGEFRFAQNLSISESEDSDTGAVETIKGTVPRTKGSEIIDVWTTNSPSLYLDKDNRPVVIGFVEDVKNKRVAYFLTNHRNGNDTDDIRSIRRAKGQGSDIVGGTAYAANSSDNCAIVLYNFESGTVTTLISGAWLNFSTKHIITGAQIIDDLLFWTDNFNQPRKINIQRAVDNPKHYYLEEQISVAKYAPYAPIRLINRNGYWAESNTASGDVYADKTSGGITSKYLRDKFVRFSYRFKYEDGEYSLMAPFTQVIFEPLNNAEMSGDEDATLDNTDFPNQVEGNNNKLAVDLHTVWRTGKVNIMQNAINTVILRIPVPNYDERDTNNSYTNGVYSNDFKIDEIEILVKESDGLAVKSLRSIKLEDTSTSDFDYYSIKPNSTSATYDRQCFKYVYKSEEPVKVLPEDQLIRVYDQVPLMAKALEISGNRVIYGNFVENYPFPLDESGKKGVDYILGVDEKGDTEHGAVHGLQQDLHRQYRHHSVKQRRTYQVGVVFSDKFGRQSPVILSSSSANDADTVYTDPVTSDHADKLIFTSAQSNSGATGNGSASSQILLDAIYPVEVGMHAVGTGIGLNKVVVSHEIVNVGGTNFTKVVVTGGPYTMTNVSIAFSNRSWSANQIAYGQALKIIFNNSQLFSGDKQIYNPVQNATYNPHGWYSYKIVVKQTEQDYYNIYASHPYHGWDNITNKQTVSTVGGKSWLSLSGDNINKVPRSLKETDFSRDGVMGSEENLYPKVVGKTGAINDYMDSMQQSQYHELTPVLTLGDAFEQSLFVSPEHSGDGTGGFQVYNWVFDRERNPLIAELPNMKNYMSSGNAGVYNSSVIIAYVTADTTDSITAVITSNSNVATIADPGDVDGYFVNGSNIKASKTPLRVESTSLSTATRTITFESKQSLKNGDMLVFSLPLEGLTVFETEPFKSKIDIFYESTTCGLVQDLNDELSDTSVANGPTNIAISSTSFSESVNSGVLGTVTATDNSGPSNLTFDLVSAYDGNNVNQAAKFTINSSSGIVGLAGSFRFTNSASDLINLKVEVNDPNSGLVFKTFGISVTNAAPTTSGNASTAVARNVGNNVTVYTDSAITNGSKLGVEDHINISDSHVFGNTAYNQYFSTNLIDNTLTVKTTSNWTNSNGTAFFNDTEANRTMTITITDSTASNLTTSFDLIINETAVGIQGFLQLSGDAGICNTCNLYQVTMYAIQHTSPTAPTLAADGELVVHAGNKLFQDANLTTPVTDDYYIYTLDCGSNCYDYKCAEVGITGDDGVVGSVITADDCDPPS